ARVTPERYTLSLHDALPISTRMYQKFRKEWLGVWEQRAREMGLDRHTAVTLASIIEKETGQKGERGLVSSVFHNRRRINMPLQRSEEHTSELQSRSDLVCRL